ncbi:glycosyl hydrolase 115 family protein [Paenibacillus arenilitoris]|uniref:Glycosyl hydrolase 115 family protein n=1 Tax=Paenibacillus arenilitoris TaxID=2772299 RepID=A0A927CJB7_9BACL|nr:glycosyl hydrolase 115 family protein [Paenibacillus arenilitoris]MBD2869144.1 glycosyl hydrolase 115 family protein [Paenibacillus arenilitoris]
MFYLTQTMTTDIYCDDEERSGVKLAVRDIIRDFRTAGLAEPRYRHAIEQARSCSIYAGSLENKRFERFLADEGVDVQSIANAVEGYRIQTIGSEGQHIAIIGSDQRGAIYGLYAFSHRYLGIDPLHLWTGKQPEPIRELTISECDIEDSASTFCYRGWFLNDEDLLLGWTGTFDTTFANNAFRKHPEYIRALLPIMETALRLKQNLLIPASLLDIMEPVDEEIVRTVTERGLLISQHHIEPVGVMPKRIVKYWSDRGDESVLSYTAHPEKYEEVWKAYAERWAKYDGVIWQLGLRGHGDKPVWEDDPHAPAGDRERGALISKAIAKQKEIISVALGHRSFESTATLWMEGMGLLKQGFLTFPEDTIIVQADFGPTQMWGEGFYDVVRDAGRSYGVYYHVGFWSCGPHLVQGTHPDKMVKNIKDAIAKGNDTYCILNVANFREMLMGIACVSELAWNAEAFELSEFKKRWASTYFGADAAQDAAAAYDDYFDAFYPLDNDGFQGRMVLLDGMCRRIGIKLMKVIQGEPFKRDRIQNKTIFAFDTASDFVAFYKLATRDSLARFNRTYDKAYRVYRSLPSERKPFFLNNLIVQVTIIRALYAWVHQLCLVAEHVFSGQGEAEWPAQVKQGLMDACVQLENACIVRLHAEQGEWANWYRGDVLLNLEQLIELTRELYAESVTDSQGI